MIFSWKRKFWDFNAAGVVATAVSHSCTAVDIAVNCTVVATIMLTLVDDVIWMISSAGGKYYH